MGGWSFRSVTIIGWGFSLEVTVGTGPSAVGFSSPLSVDRHILVLQTFGLWGVHRWVVVLGVRKL
jgi:hypothetical protein